MKGDVRHLLAGYATGTLTDAEKKELFEAALHDPELFAEIAGEEPLRELLEPAAVRAELLERIEPASPGFRERLVGWLRRPGVLAGAAAAVVVVIAVSVASLRPKALPEMAFEKNRPAEILAPVPKAAAEREPAAASPVQKVVPSVGSKLERLRQARPLDVIGGVVGGAAGGTHLKALPAPPAAAAPAPEAPPVVFALPSPSLAVANAPPLRYDVETRDAAGEFVATANPSELKDRDVVRVRFRPSRAGFLAVHDTATPDAATVFSGQVAAGAEVLTEAVTMDRDRRLQVVFVPSTPGRLSSAIRAGTEAKAADAVAAQPAQFVSAPEATGQSTFSIELRRKP
jgi:hypothetical protein